MINLGIYASKITGVADVMNHLVIVALELVTSVLLHFAHVEHGLLVNLQNLV
jgi:hypothetical protein